MIDNVVLIVTGTLHERDVNELLEKCHPLGMFDRYCCGSFLVSVKWRSIKYWLFIFFSGNQQHCITCSCSKYAWALQAGSSWYTLSTVLLRVHYIWGKNFTTIVLSIFVQMVKYTLVCHASFMFLYRIWMTWILRSWGTHSTKRILRIFTNFARYVLKYDGFYNFSDWNCCFG